LLQAFARKYHRMADQYPEAVFYEVVGDESKDLRGMMISMGVKVTPTFRLYRRGECVEKFGGVNEDNLRSAIDTQLDLNARGVAAA
jgi:Thioredoxin